MRDIEGCDTLSEGDFGVREGEGRHCMLGGRWVVAAVLDNSTIMGALLDYAAA